MTFDEDHDEIVFSNGRRAYAFSGTIGLRANGSPSYGRDGSLEESGDLTPAEKRELAAHMVALWTEYGKTA